MRRFAYGLVGLHCNLGSLSCRAAFQQSVLVKLSQGYFLVTFALGFDATAQAAVLNRARVTS